MFFFCIFLCFPSVTTESTHTLLQAKSNHSFFCLALDESEIADVHGDVKRAERTAETKSIRS